MDSRCSTRDKISDGGFQALASRMLKCVTQTLKILYPRLLRQGLPLPRPTSPANPTPWASASLVSAVSRPPSLAPRPAVLESSAADLPQRRYVFDHSILPSCYLSPYVRPPTSLWPNPMYSHSVLLVGATGLDNAVCSRLSVRG